MTHVNYALVSNAGADHIQRILALTCERIASVGQHRPLPLLELGGCTGTEYSRIDFAL